MNAEFAIGYELRDEDAWARAHQHRNLWGKLYTEVCFLDNDHVILTFRPASDQRWRAWEEGRRAWILGEEVAA